MNDAYQFAAMMALPRGLIFFDFGFMRTLFVDERFFFFCNSRPIFTFEPVKVVR